MKYSSRFFLYAPILLFLILLVGISVHWWRTAAAYEARVTAMKGQEAVPGVTLDWSTVAFSGFPFRVDVTFTDFSAQGEGPHGPFRWTSERFALHALTYGRDRKLFEAAGQQRLNWVDAGARPRSFAFQPGSLHASALRDADGLVRFDLDITQLSASDIRIGRAQFHLRRGEDGNSIDMVAQADDAKGALGPFGAAASSLRLYQTLVRANAYNLLLKGQTSPAESHEAWHNEGGMAQVTRTELEGKENAMTPEQAGAITTLLEAFY